MFKKIFISLSLFFICVYVDSSVISGQTSQNSKAEEVLIIEKQNDSGDEKNIENIERLTKSLLGLKKTNVEIKQNYLECVNINSEVSKLASNLNIFSNESCDTVYRFPPSQIPYEVSFKNGSSAKIEIKLKLQQIETYQEKTIVTLTGKVVDGYLNGAHFQNVILYPPLSDLSLCSEEPGLQELQSISASVTFILLPKMNNPESKSLERMPEAFDCFGNTSTKYTPGLSQL